MGKPFILHVLDPDENRMAPEVNVFHTYSCSVQKLLNFMRDNLRCEWSYF